MDRHTGTDKQAHRQTYGHVCARTCEHAAMHSFGLRLITCFDTPLHGAQVQRSPRASSRLPASRTGPSRQWTASKFAWDVPPQTMTSCLATRNTATARTGGCTLLDAPGATSSSDRTTISPRKLSRTLPCLLPSIPRPLSLARLASAWSGVDR